MEEQSSDLLTILCVTFLFLICVGIIVAQFFQNRAMMAEIRRGRESLLARLIGDMQDIPAAKKEDWEPVHAADPFADVPATLLT